MLGGFVLFAAGLVIVARTEFVILLFVALGLVSGISAGPIMSLPARVLGPEARAAGMGIYSSIFYAMVVAAPNSCGEDCVYGWYFAHCVRCRSGYARRLLCRLLDVQEDE